MRFTTLLTLSLILVFAFTGCAPKIYESADFSSTTRSHKQVAILPFDVTITPRKMPKDVTPDMIKEQAMNTGYSLQSDVYGWFLRQSGRRNYTVNFQDADRTNALLKDAGITYDDLRTTDRKRLAEILEVDAVISGKASMQKPMSDGAALAVGLVFGVWGPTNEVNVTLNIHDRAKGDLLWKYDHVASGSVASSTEQLSDALMRNASKRFPYQKD